MASVKTSTLDLVRELRLRQWARQHFLPVESRKSTWHPVVLDEMRRRDLELSNEKIAADVVITTEPLFGVINQSLEMLPASQMLNDRCQSDWGSTFVPLAPTFDSEYHPATVEISKPQSKTHPANSTHTSYLSESA